MKIILNLLWLIFGGLATAIEYLISSVGLMITIIGIPFGLQTLKIGILGSRVMQSVRAAGISVI